MKKNIILIFALSVISLLTFAGCAKQVENQANNQPTQQPTQEILATQETNVITVEYAKEKINDSSWVFVDTRTNDAYNGWILEGESRGGHIKGAVDFSSNWLDSKNKDKELILEKALETKGINKEKSVVLYDANGKDSLKVFEYLKAKGFENLHIFDLNKWCDDSTLEMVKYENYKLLVPAKIVKLILDGEKPETFENSKNIKMVEASWGPSSESYSKGHIPTSFHIDTDTLEPPPEWMLDNDENLAKWAIKYGFTKDDTVIVSGADQLASYRVAVVLRYIGVSDVRVLNGGTNMYTSAGYDLETNENFPVAVQDFGSEIPKNKDIIVTISELKELLKEPDKNTLVDNRGWDEFIGDVTGYSYHDKKGRIPQAIYGYAGTEGSGSLNYFRNIDNTMRNKDEILALWESEGIDIKSNLILMCGSGWRAAEVLYYTHVIGLNNTYLYSDGWIGWSNDPQNPIIMGKP